MSISLPQFNHGYTYGQPKRGGLLQGKLTRVYVPQRRYIVISSHIGSPGSTVTQIAFSPRQNLIAWTDSEGVFTRWPKPIPDTLPDPIKQSIVTNSSATTQVKPKASINLFGDGGDDLLGALGNDPFEVDLDEAMLDDNWIVDDMDGALNDEPEVTKTSNGFVKEMGGQARLSRTILELTLPSAASKHNEGSTAFPAWVNADGTQEEVSR